MFGFIAYVLGVLLINAGLDGFGAIVILIGVYLHFKWWIAAIVGFTIGINIG